MIEKFLDITEKDVLTTRKSLNETTDLTDQSISTKGQSPVELLYLQEPDFMSNMYVIYLLLRTDSNAYKHSSYYLSYYGSQNDIYDLIRKPLSTPHDLNYSMFAMRSTGINIQQKQQTTQTLRFLLGHVPKIKPQVEQIKKGSLTVDLDQDMFLLDGLHLLSGSLFTMKDHAHQKYVDPSLPWKPIKGDYYFTSIFPLLGPSGQYSLLSPGGRVRLDLVVDYDAEYRAMSRENKLTDKVDYVDKRFNNYIHRINRYIIEDVRFLGRSSQLQFTQESANKMQATFDYTFKRIFRTQV